MDGLVPALIVTVMGLFFCAFFVLAVANLLLIRHRKRSWVEATATVVSVRTVRRGRGSDSNTRIKAAYNYLGPDGQHHAGEGLVDEVTFGTDEASRQIDILVDPSRPEKSMIPRSGGSGCFIIVTIPFFLIGLGLIAFGLGLLTT